MLYSLQFALVPAFRFGGWLYVAFVALFVADAAIAIADVLVEPASRRGLGGLPAGEYLAHVVLSVLVGVYFCLLYRHSRDWASLPTAIAYAPIAAPHSVRALLWMMAGGCALMTVADSLVLIEARLPPPPPVHVSVRLRCSLRELWERTQDHQLHPTWDHRFSKIIMLAPVIRTGTLMKYEKRICAMTIRGFGRYKLHKPMRQSSFEFWSEDARSIIRRGVGLWLYSPLSDGRVEFRTSYTYEVRWGGIGRVLDRWLFRPLIQHETERSFRRLAHDHFPWQPSRVLGAVGRKREAYA
jgi:hypothetical protein